MLAGTVNKLFTSTDISCHPFRVRAWTDWTCVYIEHIICERGIRLLLLFTTYHQDRSQNFSSGGAYVKDRDLVKA